MKNQLEIALNQYCLRGGRLFIPPFLLAAILAGVLCTQSLIAQGTAFTYQGQLQNNGSPANGIYDMTFTLFKTPIGPLPGAGPLTNTATAVSNGLFTVTLDFGEVFNGSLAAPNWLEIAVRTNGGSSFTTLAPRTQLNPAPYSIYSEFAGVADTVETNSISAANLITAGSPSSGQVLAFNGTNLTWTNPAAGGGGGSNVGMTISTVQTTNSGTDSSAMGFENTASGEYSIVSGGSGNTASGIGGFVGGGVNNAAGFWDSVVGGGSNSAVNAYSFVGGGYNNAAAGEFSVIAGGYNGVANGYGAVVPGGIGNGANGNYSFAAGTYALALHTGAFVWADDSGGQFLSTSNNQFSVRALGGVRLVTGGAGMTIDGVPVGTGGGGGSNGSVYTISTVQTTNSGVDSSALGYQTTASGNYATVAGGQGNTALGNGSFIGGGGYDGLGNFGANVTSYGASAVVGGVGNAAEGYYAMVGGGYSNLASSGSAFVGGGTANTASGYASMVPGGLGNTASGDYSFAAGDSAMARNIGAFVWADASSGTPFSSTTNNQFSVRALGGVAFVTGGAGMTIDGVPVGTGGGGGGGGNMAGTNFATVAGGYENTASGSYATVGGGYQNVASGDFATVAGGGPNYALGNYSFIGGGNNNTAQGNYSFIGGGNDNFASGINSVLGGGLMNVVGYFYDTVGGGALNTASGGSSFVGAGYNNAASGYAAAVAGGYGNLANAPGGFVGGGGYDGTTYAGNSATNPAATVGGGLQNTAGGSYATVPGGYQNTANGSCSFAAGRGAKASHDGSFVWSDGSSLPRYGAFGDNGPNEFEVLASGGFDLETGVYGTGMSLSTDGSSIVIGTGCTVGDQDDTVSGGAGNQASGFGATVGGGAGNEAKSDNATVGGGTYNYAEGTNATVAGGENNGASGYAATVGGGNGNSASGAYATVPGGGFNSAQGNNSFAAGTDAHANDEDSFIWGDGTHTANSQGPESFTVQATGGVYFFDNLTNEFGEYGVELPPGATTWFTISDRNVKKNFKPVDYQKLLDKLAGVPIEQWNYKWEKDTDTPNIGPMAQDFVGAFYPGRDNKHISTLEFDGVELAAIQGLNEKLNDKDAEIQELKHSVAELKQLVQSLVEKR